MLLKTGFWLSDLSFAIIPSTFFGLRPPLGAFSQLDTIFSSTEIKLGIATNIMFLLQKSNWGAATNIISTENQTEKSQKYYFYSTEIRLRRAKNIMTSNVGQPNMINFGASQRTQMLSTMFLFTKFLKVFHNV